MNLHSRTGIIQSYRVRGLNNGTVTLVKSELSVQRALRIPMEIIQDHGLEKKICWSPLTLSLSILLDTLPTKIQMVLIPS